MNDLELLEAAAKVACVRYDPAASKPHPTSGPFWGLWLVFDDEPSEYAPRYWQPLTDDGDALRLSVKLGLDVSHNSFWNVIADHHTLPRRKTIVMAHGADPCKATRRAIVLAAAAMAVG